MKFLLDFIKVAAIATLLILIVFSGLMGSLSLGMDVPGYGLGVGYLAVFLLLIGVFGWIMHRTDNFNTLLD